MEVGAKGSGAVTKVLPCSFAKESLQCPRKKLRPSKTLFFGQVVAALEEGFLHAEGYDLGPLADRWPTAFTLGALPESLHLTRQWLQPLRINITLQITCRFTQFLEIHFPVGFRGFLGFFHRSLLRYRFLSLSLKGIAWITNAVPSSSSR